MSFKPINYLNSQFIVVLNAQKTHQNSVPNLFLKRSKQDSADFARNNRQCAMMFFDHKGFWDYYVHVISKQSHKALYSDFGVSQGASIQYISSKFSNRTFYIFKSFECLKEDGAVGKIKRYQGS